MRSVLLLVPIFLIGCGPGFKAVSYIDPLAKPYVEYYQETKAQYLGTSEIDDIDVVFGDLAGNRIGQCEIKTDQYYTYKKIVLDREFWDQADECDKIILVFHEMGHCDLGYDHREDSLMEVYHIGCTRFKADEDDFYEELFLP